MSQDIIRHPSRGPGPQNPQPSPDDLWMQQQALAVAGQPQHGLAQGGGGGNGDVQPLQMVHRSLRGRYKLAVLLAAAGAMVGTAVGWSSYEKTFRAKGTIRVDPQRVYADGKTDAQLEYTRHMGSEATFIKTVDLVQRALKRPEWTTAVPNAAAWDPAAFMARLTSAYGNQVYDINVSFDHPNRELAQAAVKATLAAYADYREEQRQGMAENSTQFVQTQRDKLQSELDVAKKSLIKLQSTDAKGDLTTSLSILAENLERRKALLQDTKFMQDAMVARKAAAEKSPPVITEAQLAMREPFFARLIAERDTLMLDLTRQQRTLGSNNPTVIKMRDTLDNIDARMKQIAEGLVKGSYGVVKGLDGLPYDVNENTLENTRLEVENLEKQVALMSVNVGAASDVRAQLDTLKNDITNLEDRLKLNAEKLADAQARSMTVNAMVRTFANPLVDVAEDKRPTMATFGFVAGGAIPLMGLVLYGMFDRKYRYSDETLQSGSTRGVPLLGILPNLPDRLSDPSQASVAAHCVHQIRTMLQLNVLGEGPSVLAVTSATSGDGKTSLSLALGLSFAASGSRTLLIDTDLIGAGLSARLGIREPAGIAEAIASRDPMSYVRDTDVGDLSVLPVGADGAQNASSFSPTAVRRLIGTVRQHFDIILIDTGPVLGSIEATPVVAASDAVILTVARGQNRDLVEKAIGHLRAIGARIAGVVFNRANARDFERSISGISLRSVSRASSMNGVQSANGQRQDKRLGPLVHSVRGTKEEIN